MNPVDLIATKRDGLEHTSDQITALVQAIVSGEMTDYQTAAWLMAVYLRGMTPAETLSLTLAMRDSGERIDWSESPGIRLDKHSTGGVGDKTSLVVAPILAAAGIPILKMSGRGLGYSGGTIDKLESIPGLRTDINIWEAKEQVERISIAIIGQSKTMVPADKILYGLRDVTATIASIPLIAASIMSKKLAGGADVVLLDVKVGSGSFMKTQERAAELARTMVAIGTGAGVKTHAMLTDMDSPLGIAVGNALEVREAIEVLSGKWSSGRFRELCNRLTARALLLAGKAANESEATAITNHLIECGAALQKLGELIEAQGGNPDVIHNTNLLPMARNTTEVFASASGTIQRIDAERIGQLSVEMGAGRLRKSDQIDPTAGIVFHVGLGDDVRSGDILAEFDHNDNPRAAEFSALMTNALTISDAIFQSQPIVLEEF